MLKKKKSINLWILLDLITNSQSENNKNCTTDSEEN